MRIRSVGGRGRGTHTRGAADHEGITRRFDREARYAQVLDGPAADRNFSGLSGAPGRQRDRLRLAAELDGLSTITGHAHELDREHGLSTRGRDLYLNGQRPLVGGRVHVLRERCQDLRGTLQSCRHPDPGDVTGLGRGRGDGARKGRHHREGGGSNWRLCRRRYLGVHTRGYECDHREGGEGNEAPSAHGSGAFGVSGADKGG